MYLDSQSLEGDGTNAQLSDFTSFLDNGGSFYLGGNSSGMSGSASRRVVVVDGTILIGHY